MRIFAAVALALMVPATVSGQNSPATLQADGTYARLADALSPISVQDAQIAAVFRDLRTVMLRDPDIAILEADCPGTVDTLIEKSRPLLLEYSAVETAVLRKETIALFRQNLSDAEATQLAQMYESSEEQKLIAAVNSSVMYEQTIGSSMEGDLDAPMIIKKEDVQADKRCTVAATIGNLSAAELREIGKRIEATPAFPKIIALRPKLDALQIDVANRDIIPGFDPRLDAVMEAAIEESVEICGL